MKCNRCEGEGEIHDADFSDGDSDHQMFLRQDTLRQCPECAGTGNVFPVDQIICGDNCEVLGTFPRECIDLVVTSPPYDDLRTYGGHEWNFEILLDQLWRVIKPGGVIVWVVADATVDGSETGSSFRQALRFMEVGFRLHDTMIWDKGGCPARGSNAAYLQVMEYMFVFSKGKPTAGSLLRDRPNKYAGAKIRQYDYSKDGGKRDAGTRVIPAESRRTNIWRICDGDAVQTGHPAVFPDALARDHIISWSNEGGVVLDPFNGSGTTTTMAREMGRRYIGIEVNPEYCEHAKARIAQQLLPLDG